MKNLKHKALMNLLPTQKEYIINKYSSICTIENCYIYIYV